MINCGTVGPAARTAGEKTLALVGHPTTQKWTFYAFMEAWAIADALRDSHVHKDHYLHDDHTKYLTGGSDLWHGYKNAGRLFGMIAGAALIAPWAQGDIGFWHMLNRGLNGACMSVLPWDMFYRKNKDNLWYTRDAQYHKHALPYINPFEWPWQDSYIALEGWEVDAYYGGLTAFGVTRAIFFDPARRNHGRCAE